MPVWYFVGMWKKRDQVFVQVLGDAAKLDKRLNELGSVRKWCGIASIPMVLVIFYVGFTILSGITQTSGRLDHVTTWHVGGIINSIFTIVSLLICLSKAVCAHNELRMLLLFKTLREDKSVSTP